MKKPTTSKHQLAVAEAWRNFYESHAGRIAIADLMVWCNVYSPILETDPLLLAAANGERNAALRIVQMIGLKAEHFPTQSWDDTDMLDRLMTRN